MILPSSHHARLDLFTLPDIRTWAWDEVYNTGRPHQALGMQVPAVKSRLHRARELVREYMIGPISQTSKHD